MGKRKDISRQLIWMHPGDHTSEADQLIVKNIRENGRLIGAPSVIVRQFPKGTFTVLSADREWWEDEMRLHSDWNGPIANDSSFFDYLTEAGNRPNDT